MTPSEDLDLHPVATDFSSVEPIPVIDIAPLLADDASVAARSVARDIAEACRSWGFFQVTGHGLDQQLVDNTWRHTRALFQLPLADKLALQRSEDNPWGFYNHELTKKQRDKKEIFDFTGPGRDAIYDRSNRWPEDLPGFQPALAAWLDACSALSGQLLAGFCLGLDLAPDYLQADCGDDHTGFMRLNRYPLEDPMAGTAIGREQAADLGIHHHSDAGALTILLQDDVQGLQVYREGSWYDVPTISGALVVNTGDMMQVWSNDNYLAPVHRVREMKDRERHSIAFFFNPAASCEVRPLASQVDAQRPARYRPIHWGEYRSRRSEGDFADYGTAVQISQYRI